jgi:hypothetical protein
MCKQCEENISKSPLCQCRHCQLCYCNYSISKIALDHQDKRKNVTTEDLARYYKT